MIKSLLVGMYVLSLQVCPDPSALETFKHQIAYEMTEELRPFAGLVSMHTDVWMQGPITVFYVRDQARGFAPNERPLYMFNPHGRNGGAICSANDPLQICLQKSLDIKTVETTAQTCTATINLRSIRWAPSPNDRTKREIANELREEIETRFPDPKEIIIRDFNLDDPQITFYIKASDGDYFQGCGFQANVKPHCESWHLFGQAPRSALRKWVLDKPYRLK